MQVTCLINPSLHSSLSSWVGITLSPWSSLAAMCSYSSILMAALVWDLLELQPILTPHLPVTNYNTTHDDDVSVSISRSVLHHKLSLVFTFNYYCVSSL